MSHVFCFPRRKRVDAEEAHHSRDRAAHDVRALSHPRACDGAERHSGVRFARAWLGKRCGVNRAECTEAIYASPVPRGYRGSAQARGMDTHGVTGGK
jgi:hypothetical protein